MPAVRSRTDISAGCDVIDAVDRAIPSPTRQHRSNSDTRALPKFLIWSLRSRNFPRLDVHPPDSSFACLIELRLSKRTVDNAAAEADHKARR